MLSCKLTGRQIVVEKGEKGRLSESRKHLAAAKCVRTYVVTITDILML